MVGGKRSRAKAGKEEEEDIIGIGIAIGRCRLKKGISSLGGGFGLDFGRRRRRRKNPKTPPKMRWRAMWWEEECEY